MQSIVFIKLKMQYNQCFINKAENYEIYGTAVGRHGTRQKIVGEKKIGNSGGRGGGAAETLTAAERRQIASAGGKAKNR